MREAPGMVVLLGDQAVGIRSEVSVRKDNTCLDDQTIVAVSPGFIITLYVPILPTKCLPQMCIIVIQHLGLCDKIPVWQFT